MSDHGRPDLRRLRLLAALVVAVSTTVLAGRLADGSGPGADTISWAPGATNGFQVADLPIVGVAVVGLGACAFAALGRTPIARLTATAAAVVVLTVLGLTLIKGDGPDSGRTVVTVTAGLGLNSGDLPVVAILLVGIVACGLLAATARYGVRSR